MSDHTQATESVKGIHISRMNAAIILISLALYILLTVTAFRVSGIIHDSYLNMDDFSSCTQIGELFRDGSDYLTEQARLYVSTGDQAYMDNYFTEIHTNCRRDGAVEILARFDLKEGTLACLQSALDKSTVLTGQEIYAMALVSLAQHYDEASLPPEVQQAALTAEDRAMTQEEQLSKAKELVFGSDYQAMKGQISNDVEDMLYALADSYGERMDKNYKELHHAMVSHQALIGLHFAATLVSFAFTLLLVILPMRSYVKHIQDRKPLRVFGAHECRRLAQTYNTMLAYITANEHSLRHQAEHDALTKLLNRGAFDSLQASLESYSGPLALLLVDVDKFKQINDGYGHETGDQILKKVAALLSQSFRTTDYPARIGGDEFAVIVMDTSPEEQDAIAAKIAAVNEALTHPTDGLPVVSLSVGGAFSGAGFTQNLYKDADSALYEVKEHGRCGCRFFNPELARR